MIRVCKVIIYRMRCFSHERSEWEKSNAVKITFHTSVIQYFISREPNNYIKVMILRLEWYKNIKCNQIFLNYEVVNDSKYNCFIYIWVIPCQIYTNIFFKIEIFFYV